MNNKHRGNGKLHAKKKWPGLATLHSNRHHNIFSLPSEKRPTKHQHMLLTTTLPSPLPLEISPKKFENSQSWENDEATVPTGLHLFCGHLSSTCIVSSSFPRYASKFFPW